MVVMGGKRLEKGVLELHERVGALIRLKERERRLAALSGECPQEKNRGGSGGSGPSLEIRFYGSCVLEYQRETAGELTQLAEPTLALG